MKVETETLRTIEDLPDEVLEFILSFVSPYKDINNCVAVSKRWLKCVSNVTKIKQRNLRKAIADFNISWNTMTPVPTKPSITQRCSHAVAVHENSMYVFGGRCQAGTTLNDLWRLDLSNKQWVRPYTKGMNRQKVSSKKKFPSPKACCTMVNYKDLLIVFGGWLYQRCCQFYSERRILNELHAYDIAGKRWTYIKTELSPPEIAAHSVSLHRKHMVVFGGLIQQTEGIVDSNDVWTLDLETWEWQKRETIGRTKPCKRHCQSQYYIDDRNAFILGGNCEYGIEIEDAWLLNMDGDIWKWFEVEVRQVNNAPSIMHWRSSCKVGDKLIALYPTIKVAATPPCDTDVINVEEPWANVAPSVKYGQEMYVLDISHVLDEQPYATWLPYKDNGQFSLSPQAKLHYSFVEGKGELIVFGGDSIGPDSAEWQKTNSLQFITAPKYII